MDERQTKRIRKAAVDSSLKQKLQNLPLLCVEAICKVTPTSRLIRLYSTAVPLLGASWNFGLEAALKRRKISLSEDPSYDKIGYPSYIVALWDDGKTRIDALFDSSGAKVATIKHPEAFHLSPLCEFVQSATVPFRVLPAFAVAEDHLRCVFAGQPLLPHLPNVINLTLVDLGDVWKHYLSTTFDFLLPILKQVLPQLESFAFGKGRENRQMVDSTLVEVLPEMAGLKQLSVHPGTFGSLMRSATAASEGSKALCPGLSSIHLRQALCDGYASLAVQFVNFMSACCTQLTQLSIMVQGELKPFLVALRALTNLTVLSLELYNVNIKGMIFSEDQAVGSVLELRLVHEFAFLSSGVEGAVASLFPNVKAAALRYDALATELCHKRIWPKLEKLTCFSGSYLHNISTTHFLASPNLPSSVDLSPIINEALARDSSTLTDIYRAVQIGPIKMLLLRGPLNREALPRLQAYIDFNGESAKITAWKDRDLGEQTSMIINCGLAAVPAFEFSELTDVRIDGTKEKGGVFSIRVVHQLTKTTDILD